MTLITIFVFFCCVDAGIKETFVLSAEELKEKKNYKTYSQQRRQRDRLYLGWTNDQKLKEGQGEVLNTNRFIHEFHIDHRHLFLVQSRILSGSLLSIMSSELSICLKL